MATSPIPIFLYHSVTDDPPEWLRPWSLPPSDFAAQLDLMIERGCTPMTVSCLVDTLASGAALPQRPVVVTFDDGYADTLTTAAPAMAKREIVSTVYVTTGALEGRPKADRLRLGPAAMLDWRELRDLELHGVEIGAHSHTHGQLDTERRRVLGVELELPKRLLEEHLGHAVHSFAYPHGYSSPIIRRMVAEAGYDSACGVRNALSSAADDRYSLARLTVMRTTPVSVIGDWLDGAGAVVAPAHEWQRTKAWRVARRAIAVTRREGRTPYGPNGGTPGTLPATGPAGTTSAGSKGVVED
jgi:peptidoglycan/xylan/chitin deacetylase (PgdA/CDA1 family)